MTIAKTRLCTAAALLALLPMSTLAQDDEDRRESTFLKVDVDVNVSNLTDEVAGIIVSCWVESLYEETGVVGEGKVFIHSEADYPTEAFNANGIAALPIDFIPTDGVFGRGGSRSFAQTVAVILTDPNETVENGQISSRIETWVKGDCVLELVTAGWDFAADVDDFEGNPPTDCGDGRGQFFTCIRPGTSIQDAYFGFERDFGLGAESGDDN